jgi:transcriptional regulator with XRE-family HTH domain
MPTDNPFAAALRRERGRRSWTVAQLAERAGLHRTHVYKLEAGQRAPAWATVQALARALKVKAEAFR